MPNLSRRLSASSISKEVTPLFMAVRIESHPDSIPICRALSPRLWSSSNSASVFLKISSIREYMATSRALGIYLSRRSKMAQSCSQLMTKAFSPRRKSRLFPGSNRLKIEIFCSICERGCIRNSSFAKSQKRHLCQLHPKAASRGALFSSWGGMYIVSCENMDI